MEEEWGYNCKEGTIRWEGDDSPCRRHWHRGPIHLAPVLVMVHQESIAGGEQTSCGNKGEGYQCVDIHVLFVLFCFCFVFVLFGLVDLKRGRVSNFGMLCYKPGETTNHVK